MFFLPALACKNCPQSISLPLPIPSETPSRQIAWPCRAVPGNFLSPSCLRVSAYLAEECRWNRTQNTDQRQTSKQTAIYRISVQCGKAPCVDQLHILTLAPPGFDVEAAASLLGSVDLNGISCDSGHPNYGRTIPMQVGGASISVEQVFELWD